MSRRERQGLRRAVLIRKRTCQHEQALAAAIDPQTQARLTAAYARETLGHVPIWDRQPHRLCDLGLLDVTRSPAPREAGVPHPPVIHTARRR